MKLIVVEGSVARIVLPLFKEGALLQGFQIVVIADHGVEGNLNVLEQFGDGFIVALLPVFQ